MSPLAHIKKFELVAGDATETIPAYLDQRLETIVSLAYFDSNLYESTKVWLEAIRDRLVKCSVLVFEELNDPDSPVETLALMEVMGLDNVRLRRWPNASRVSHLVLE